MRTEAVRAGIDESGLDTPTSDDQAAKALGITGLKISFILLAVISIFPFHHALGKKTGLGIPSYIGHIAVLDWAVGIVGAVLCLVVVVSAPVALLLWRRARSRAHRPGPLAYLAVAAVTLTSAYILALPFLANRIPWMTV